MKNPQKQPLTDETLSQLLRELPRHEASLGFVNRTLAAARHEPKPKRLPYFTFAMATACVFVTMLWLKSNQTVPVDHSAPVAAAPAASMQADLAELERMSQEIQRLQALSRSKTPMLRVGSPSQPEYFIDMRSVANATAEKTYAHFRPTRHF